MECYQRVNWSIAPGQPPFARTCCFGGGPGGRYDLGPVRSGEIPEEAPTPGADDRLAPLRGAGVAANARKVGKIVLAVVLAGLAGLAVVLFAAGARKNAQISELHQHGVPVEMTVTGCIGLLGGSGSNDAGYSCHGTFVLQGHRYDDAIPGNMQLAPGSTLAGVTVASDPALFTTAALLPTQHTSSSVYLAPIVLTIVLVLALVLIAVVRRRRHARSRAGGPAGSA